MEKPIKNEGNLGYIDTIIYDIVEPLDKVFRKLNFNPNVITSISIPFGIIGLYLFYKGSYFSIPFYFIYILLDYSDGYFARKYNMVTDFGDYYDHIRDAVFAITLLTLFLLKIYKSKKHKYILIFILILLGIYACISFSSFMCTEKDQKHNNSIAWAKNMCIHEQFFKKNKFIDIGSLFVFCFISMALFIYLKK
jgi:phosphatidylglycerophosphate synthase